MSPSRINWFAVFAVGVGSWSVASNYDLALTAPWLAGLAVGGLAALAWTADRRVGLWLSGVAAVLAVATLVRSGPISPDSLAATSGACAGMMLGLFIGWLWSRAHIRRM
jgi:hypothetical protein